MTDNTLRMQYADDGQPNYSNWSEEEIGEVGEYAKRLVWTRLGSSRQRVYRFTCSSPRRRDVLGAVLDVDEGNT